MGPQLAANFQQAKARLNTWNNLKAQLPPAQERLSREHHQLRQLEHCLAEVEQKLHQLESFSLGGLMSSLLGRKESEVASLQTDAERLRTELEAATDALTSTDGAVRQIEEQLKVLGDPQRAMASLIEDAEKQLLEGDAGQPSELADLSSQLAVARGQRREFQKAVQVGKQLGLIP